MPIKADFVVVGSGVTGATIARTLHDANREVVVLERRQQVGGNVVDAVHVPSGIRYGVHGPHYFRTSSERIWEFATRFGCFWPYEHRVLSYIEGEFVPWPPQRSWIERLCGKDWQPAFKGTPRNLEEAALLLMPQIIYEKMVKCYNEKMWGKPCTELSASLCRRFDVRDGETRLSAARYQGIPKSGYSSWMAKILDGIPVIAGFDYLKRRDEVQARRHLVFTGPIDEYFDFSLGRLEYRAQRRHHQHFWTRRYYPAAQVNFPQHRVGKHIRAIEWRHLMPPESTMRGSFVTTETPYSPTDPDAYEYPFPDGANDRLREAYLKLAKELPQVTFAGRLGTGKYLDMDQAIAHGMSVASSLLKSRL